MQFFTISATSLAISTLASLNEMAGNDESLCIFFSHWRGLKIVG
jgi:hypothetical protein